MDAGKNTFAPEKMRYWPFGRFQIYLNQGQRQPRERRDGVGEKTIEPEVAGRRSAPAELAACIKASRAQDFITIFTATTRNVDIFLRFFNSAGKGSPLLLLAGGLSGVRSTTPRPALLMVVPMELVAPDETKRRVLKGRWIVENLFAR